MPQWRWILSRLIEKIWFRAAIISLVAVLLALASAVLAPLMPYELSLKIGGAAVDNILTILASSMLAVTTFSLTAMVTAFSGATANITPRATKLLIEDATAQNALSTFLGGFLFAIVGIIALSTELYGEQGRAILFLGTIGIIIVIVVTLLRWIGRLGQFGRVQDAIERIETKAIRALDDYPGPRLAAGRSDLTPGKEAHLVRATETGHVGFADRKALGECARKNGVRLTLAAPAGSFVDPTRPLAWADGATTTDIADTIRNAFTILPGRDFDQDPRFGMVVLAEIASRALSPGINDPGTAIAVLMAGQRVLDGFADPDPDNSNGVEGVIDAPLAFEDMVEDLVLPIARDGAGLFEVGIRLQQMLGSLAERVPPARGFLLEVGSAALERARAAMENKADIERVEAAHRQAFAQSRVPLSIAHPA